MALNIKLYNSFSNCPKESSIRLFKLNSKANSIIFDVGMQIFSGKIIESSLPK